MDSTNSSSTPQGTSPPASAAAAAAAAAAPAPPSPPRWAFEAAYGQPLPAHLQFHHHTGFKALSDHMAAASANRAPDQIPRVNPLIATYPTGANKQSWTGNPALSAEEREDYQCGAPISSATKRWTAGGSVGVVTSSMSSASQQSQKQNDWHTVAMARSGNKVWVHDPAYSADRHAGNVKRVDGVSGTGNVHRLVQEWPNVEGVYFQGPPSTYAANPGQLECMGRSAQWVEATQDSTLPWPPDRDASGGQWTFHYRN